MSMDPSKTYVREANWPLLKVSDYTGSNAVQAFEAGAGTIFLGLYDGSAPVISRYFTDGSLDEAFQPVTMDYMSRARQCGRDNGGLIAITSAGLQLYDQFGEPERLITDVPESGQFISGVTRTYEGFVVGFWRSSGSRAWRFYDHDGEVVATNTVVGRSVENSNYGARLPGYVVLVTTLPSYPFTPRCDIHDPSTGLIRHSIPNFGPRVVSAEGSAFGPLTGANATLKYDVYTGEQDMDWTGGFYAGPTDYFRSTTNDGRLVVTAAPGLAAVHPLQPAHAMHDESGEEDSSAGPSGVALPSFFHEGALYVPSQNYYTQDPFEYAERSGVVKLVPAGPDPDPPPPGAWITFLPLSSTNEYADGTHRRRYRSSGSTLAVGQVQGLHRRALRSLGVAYTSALEIDPEIPAMGVHGRAHRSQGDTFQSLFADGEHRRRLRSTGYASAQAGYVGGEHRRRLSSWGRWEDAAAGYGLAMAPPFHVSSFGGMWFAPARATLNLGAAPSPLPTMVTHERVGFGGLPASVFEGIVAAYDRLSIGERMTPIVMALAEDTVVLNAIAEGDQTMLVRVVERLLLTGEASGVAEAVAIVVDAMVLGAIAGALQVGRSEDTLLLGEVIASTYQVVAAAVERLLLAGTGDSHYLAMALVRDTVQLGDGVLHEAELAALVRDAISFAATIRLDNGEYIAWVMNTESKGLSRYTNYPFNSFAKIGDRYVGCSPQGLHWLDGATDNGDEIHAKLRLGMEDMGTRRLKNIPDAYIGYTSDGVLLLRAIYTHEATGDRVAATYRLSPREAHETREHRFKLGRGLKAVDWDFEIENVDGSDFELSNVEFRPLVLNRRTRG